MLLFLLKVYCVMANTIIVNIGSGDKNYLRKERSRYVWLFHGTIAGSNLGIIY